MLQRRKQREVSGGKGIKGVSLRRGHLKASTLQMEAGIRKRMQCMLHLVLCLSRSGFLALSLNQEDNKDIMLTRLSSKEDTGYRTWH